MQLDPVTCFRAVAARDRRFEGRFFLGVTTTGVYCRPGCPARLPKQENVKFYASAAAAEGAGFRACARCRPDMSRGSPAAMGTSATVARALRLIERGGLDAARVDDLASRLGVGERHLRRLFEEHLGASPAAVARSRRLHFARALVEDTELAMSEIALASGFSSVRRFNEAMLAAFRKAPSALRGAGRPASRVGVELRLRARPPFDFEGVLAFLAPRSIPGVEQVEHGSYRRTASFDARVAIVEVSRAPGEALRVRLENVAASDLFATVERVGALFDVDADADAIDAVLAADPMFEKLVRARPGLRVPGAWDAFELAVRAVLGQQVSVAHATALAGRLVASFGEAIDSPRGALTHAFPCAARLVEAPIEKLGMPVARAETIRGVARAALRGELDEGPHGIDGARRALDDIKGVGPWTTEYVAMRAWKDPDAFPASDLGLRKAIGAEGAPARPAEVERAVERLRPYRAYAAMHLWGSLARPAEASNPLVSTERGGDR